MRVPLGAVSLPVHFVITPSLFSKLMSSLPEDLTEALAEASTPRQAVDAFIEWYEQTAVRGKRDFTSEVRRLSEPGRQFAALHIAWNMIATDGMVEYFTTVEEDWFDELAIHALQELEQAGSADALVWAREVYDRFGEDFPTDIEEELHGEFFDPIEDLELQIGSWLLDQM